METPIKAIKFWKIHYNKIDSQTHQNNGWKFITSFPISYFPMNDNDDKPPTIKIGRWIIRTKKSRQIQKIYQTEIWKNRKKTCVKFKTSYTLKLPVKPKTYVIKRRGGEI